MVFHLVGGSCGWWKRWRGHVMWLPSRGRAAIPQRNNMAAGCLLRSEGNIWIFFLIWGSCLSCTSDFSSKVIMITTNGQISVHIPTDSKTDYLLLSHSSKLFLYTGRLKTHLATMLLVQQKNRCSWLPEFSQKISVFL